MKLLDYLESHLPHRRMHRHHARMAWLASAVPAKLRSAWPGHHAPTLPRRMASTAAMMLPARHAAKGLSGGVVALAAAVVFASWFLMRRD